MNPKHLDYSVGVTTIGFRNCPSCPYVMPYVLTSNPPQYICSIDRSYHLGTDICTRFVNESEQELHGNVQNLCDSKVNE